MVAHVLMYWYVTDILIPQLKKKAS